MTEDQVGFFCQYCGKRLRPERRHEYDGWPRKTKAAVIVVFLGISLSITAWVLLTRINWRRAPGESQHPAVARAASIPVQQVEIASDRTFTFTVDGADIQATVHEATDYGRNRLMITLDPAVEKTDINFSRASLETIWNLHGRDRGVNSASEAKTSSSSKGGKVLSWEMLNPREEFYSMPLVDPDTQKLTSLVVWTEKPLTDEDLNRMAARLASNEVAAIGFLRAISLAEVKYSNSGGSEKYGSMRQIIESGCLRAGGNARASYRFSLRTRGDFFEAFASPIRYGSTGRRSFYISSADFQVHGTDARGGDASPGSPLAE